MDNIPLDFEAFPLQVDSVAVGIHRALELGLIFSPCTLPFIIFLGCQPLASKALGKIFYCSCMLELTLLHSFFTILRNQRKYPDHLSVRTLALGIKCVSMRLFLFYKPFHMYICRDIWYT